MKKAVLIGALFLFALFLQSAEPVPLPGVVRPSVFIVKADRIYILENAIVSIYSLKDFTLIKQFGKAGEGPREFKYSGNNGRPLSMTFQGDKLAVNSTNRMSYFTLDGEYVGEENLVVDMLLFGVGGQFVGVGPTSDAEGKTQKIGFRLYDAKYKPGQLIFLSTLDVGNPRELMIPADTFTYNPVYKDRIYINSSSDRFVIDVFDAGGKKLYSIEKDYPLIPQGEENKKLTHEFFKTNPRFKPQYEYIKNILKFRDNFPPLRDFYLEADRIHAITYKRQGDLWEMIVLDLKGKELGRTFIPLAEYEPFTFYPILYSICQDKVYTLVENDEDDGWMMLTTQLKLK